MNGLLAAAFLAALLPTGSAHPVHAARVEVASAPDARVIATVLVYEEDFPPGRDLEAIDGYLKRTLQLRESDGTVVQFRVNHARPVGDRLRITLCSTAPVALAGASIAVTILQERFDDQVNVVVIRHEDATEELVFVRGDGRQGLP